MLIFLVDKYFFFLTMNLRLDGREGCEMGGRRFFFGLFSFELFLDVVKLRFPSFLF